MEQRISIITLTVTDLTRSRGFYERLGWKIFDAEGSDKIIFFQLNGLVLALYPADKMAEEFPNAHFSRNPEEYGKCTIAYNCRSKSGVDRAIDQAEAAGATILRKPKDTFWGGYSGYFADPDKNVWEIAYGDFYGIDKQGNFKLQKKQTNKN